MVPGRKPDAMNTNSLVRIIEKKQLSKYEEKNRKPMLDLNTWQVDSIISKLYNSSYKNYLYVTLFFKEIFFNQVAHFIFVALNFYNQSYYTRVVHNT